MKIAAACFLSTAGIPKTLPLRSGVVNAAEHYCPDVFSVRIDPEGQERTDLEDMNHWRRCSTVKINIDKLTERELIDLNHRIVERLRFLESMRTHAEMMDFSVGEKVSFRPSGRERLIGTLVKYNRKTVSVLTEDGQKWNVSPHLLEKVRKSEGPAQQSGNVIDIKPK